MSILGSQFAPSVLKGMFDAADVPQLVLSSLIAPPGRCPFLEYFRVSFLSASAVDWEGRWQDDFTASSAALYWRSRLNERLPGGDRIPGYPVECRVFSIELSKPR
jgi:hypothetical protein